MNLYNSGFNSAASFHPHLVLRHHRGDQLHAAMGLLSDSQRISNIVVTIDAGGGHLQVSKRCTLVIRLCGKALKLDA